MWEAFLNMEENILLWIQESVRSDVLTPMIKFITYLGDNGFIWIAIAVVCLFFARTRKAGILVGVSLLGSLLVNNVLLKNMIARTRPYEVVDGLQRIIEEQGDLSFPSGHTGSSFAAAVVLLLLCPRKVGIPAMILAFLISISRIYVGVHYPTDVLAGMVTGTLVALAVCRICRKWTDKRID